MSNNTFIDEYDFIKKIAKYSQKHAPNYNIAIVSPVIAQGFLESAHGTSYKAKFHNYFGMKYRANRVTCHNGTFTDGGSEQNADGSYTLLPGATQWYSFADVDHGVEGYFQFTNISNYKKIKGETDPKKYLEYIKAAGYATSHNYVKNVYNVITKYNLTQYDTLVEDRTYKVAIDAGHGSNTSGKRHPDGYREHYSNVYIAYYLDQILRKNGIETFKVSWDDDIATDDNDVALATRQSQVKNEGCDILVSVHANAYGDGKSYNNVEGIETFYHTDNAKIGDSLKLANCLQTELLKGTTQVNRGVKRQNLAMCNCTAMGVKAAALVETGFMTNKRESELLKSDLYWRECARELAQGIFNYFGIYGNTAIALTSIKGTVTDTGSSNKQETTPNVSSTKSTIKAGTEFSLKKVKMYASSTATSYSTKTGTYWVWSNEVINSRIRVTNAKSRVGISGQVSGWVDESVLLSLNKPSTPTTTTKSNYVHEGLDYSPIFNPNFYMNKYPDLHKAFGTDKTKLFNHFIKYGMKEGRMPCQHFNVHTYMNRYADLKKVFGNNLPEYYKHFLKYGIKEERIPY